MRSVLCWLLLALLPLSVSAADTDLAGAWRPADPDEAAASVRSDDARMRAFDPARLHQFASETGEAWIVLRPASGTWPDPPWVLEARSPGLQRLTLYSPGAAPRSAQLMRPLRDTWPGHGSLPFEIASALPDGEPLVLRVDGRGVIPSTMTFAAKPVADYLRDDARWVAFASACLAVMLAMAVVSLFFAFRLNDPAFVYYALFVSAYAVILALQTGYAADPVGWHASIAAVRAWGRIATTVSIVFAVLFLDRFAHLARFAPGWRRLLLGYAGAVAALAALGLAPLDGAGELGRVLINPLLILGGPLLLCAAGAAALRGSRYAAFFLVGWTMLLVTTVLSSLQLYGFAPGWTWSDSAAFAAGAFEALVLSMGLAERSLAIRRDRDQARRLADIDALTGLYNRRAWTDRLLALEDLESRSEPFSVLFLDLDRFKELNDRLGHEAGDSALRTLAGVMREELREEDLIGRYGGEEFVVALPGADRAHASRVAERIRQRLQDLAQSDPTQAMRTVSIGVATLRSGENTTSLLKRADAAMYAAKAAGRNRVIHAA